MIYDVQLLRPPFLVLVRVSRLSEFRWHCLNFCDKDFSSKLLLGAIDKDNQYRHWISHTLTLAVDGIVHHFYWKNYSFSFVQKERKKAKSLTIDNQIHIFSCRHSAGKRSVTKREEIAKNVSWKKYLAKRKQTSSSTSRRAETFTHSFSFCHNNHSNH